MMYNDFKQSQQPNETIYTKDLQKVSALLYFRGKWWGREE